MAGEPLQRAPPTVRRRFGVVAGAGIAMEPVLGIGVAHDAGVDRGGLERGAQRLDALDRDPRVLIAEEPEPGCRQCGRLIDERRERQAEQYVAAAERRALPRK